MKNNSSGDFMIDTVLVIAAAIAAAFRFREGETVDGILWAIVAAVTLAKEVRRY